MTFSQLRGMQRRGLTREQARDALIEQKLEIDDIEKQLKIYDLLLLWGEIRIPLLIASLLLLLLVSTLWFLGNQKEQREADMLATEDFGTLLLYTLEENNLELCLRTEQGISSGYTFSCVKYHAAKQQNPSLCTQYLSDALQLAECVEFVELAMQKPQCASPTVSPTNC